MWSAEAVSPSSPDWQARPDSGDGYHKGQLSCRKPVVQAVFSQPHYSGQVDPGNCSSAKVDIQSTNCVMQYRMTIMIQFPGVKKKTKNDCKQLWCLIWLEHNKGTRELCTCVGRYTVWCTCKPISLMHNLRQAAFVRSETVKDQMEKLFELCTTIVITISVMKETARVQLAHSPHLAEVRCLMLVSLLTWKRRISYRLRTLGLHFRYSLMCLTRHGKSIISEH